MACTQTPREAMHTSSRSLPLHTSTCVKTQADGLGSSEFGGFAQRIFHQVINTDGFSSWVICLRRLVPFRVATLPWVELALL
jgi:hypothetical protein